MNPRKTISIALLVVGATPLARAADHFSGNPDTHTNSHLNNNPNSDNPSLNRSAGTSAGTTLGTGSLGTTPKTIPDAGSAGQTVGEVTDRSDPHAKSSASQHSGPGTGAISTTVISANHSHDSSSLQDIQRDPNRFLGKKVSLQGEVVQKSSDGNAFILEDKGSKNNRIIVLTAKKKHKKKKKAAAPSENSDLSEQDSDLASIRTNDAVKVTGTVRNLSAQEAGQQYDADFSDLKSDWNSKMPVIVSDANLIVPASQKSH